MPLVPQPHGGAIRRGSAPGNTPGTGRPPSAVRAAMLEAGAARIPILTDIADGIVRTEIRETCPQCGYAPKGAATAEDLISAVPAIADRRGAIDTLFKYGLGTKDEVTLVSPDVQARVARMVEVIASRPTWDSPALLTELSPIFQP